MDQYLTPAQNPGLILPEFPKTFEITFLNPASSGPKGGIRILQLEIPYRLGTIRVTRNNNMWILSTTNVRRFGFVHDDRHNSIMSWTVDDTVFPNPPKDAGPSYLKNGDHWEVFLVSFRLLLIFCGLVGNDILLHMAQFLWFFQIHF